MSDTEMMQATHAILIRIEAHLERIDASLTGPGGLHERMNMAEREIATIKAQLETLQRS